MENSLYVGLSRQLVLDHAMTLVANNVANANTPGYRAQNPMFEEYIAKSSGYTNQDPLSMVYDMGQYDTTSPGSIQVTGGTYDVALMGPGFIEVMAPSGQTQYTRGGDFTLNGNSELVTSAGFRVSGPGGNPVSIPVGSEEVVITNSGEVTADGNVVGKISVVEFDNIQDLTPAGNGLYSSSIPGRAATETTVKQGAIEGSNINPVQEMTRMIEILRTYQSTMNMMKNEHDRQMGAIQKISKLNA
ncbi:MAG: flagellar basal-body rod protein FlgF [Alphaproteobacteria bacterium]|jgi:flagellar basal-body rod protein FlgF|nr:flagellar basal-body rod protein FlgF [Alphaproteobacteria bacterium]MCB1550764.1 flagellar basal-body rod protein FlgF [Alphaproteobacteria bacterium]MCB9984395.1 flagellar basal-body rod protein FlgF [Micavibrio sp.]HRK97839.1 flagellar basal-body rod protein FlgF [Alphaproteobacteria bacterium]